MGQAAAAACLEAGPLDGDAGAETHGLCGAAVASEAAVKIHNSSWSNLTPQKSGHMSVGTANGVT